MLFENVGHSPFAERPEAFNDALLEFAQENWRATPGH
jgi:pimeloyl-ACP methyl ester carboxylesterase